METKDQAPTPRKPIPIKLIVGLTLGLVCLILAIQNTGPVEIHIFFFTWIMPKIVLILAIALLGFGAGYFLRKRRDTRSRPKD